MFLNREQFEFYSKQYLLSKTAMTTRNMQANSIQKLRENFIYEQNHIYQNKTAHYANVEGLHSSFFVCLRTLRFFHIVYKEQIWFECFLVNILQFITGNFRKEKKTTTSILRAFDVIC